MLWEYRAQVIEITDEIRVRHTRASPPARKGRPRSPRPHARRARKLTAARKHLDAVIFERIVRSGNHNISLVTSRSREIGNGRRRPTPALVTLRLLAPVGAHFDPGTRLRACHARSAARRGRSGLRGKARTRAAPTRRTVGGSRGIYRRCREYCRRRRDVVGRLTLAHRFAIRAFSFGHWVR